MYDTSVPNMFNILLVSGRHVVCVQKYSMWINLFPSVNLTADRLQNSLWLQTCFSHGPLHFFYVPQ